MELLQGSHRLQSGLVGLSVRVISIYALASISHLPGAVFQETQSIPLWLQQWRQQFHLHWTYRVGLRIRRPAFEPTIFGSSWFHLYTISKISQYLTKEQKQTIIHAYVTPRLDQNNSGLPSTQMNKLQLVQYSAAKIILGGKKYDHVTDHLIKLHWLPISPSPSGALLRSCSSFLRY